MSIKLPDNMVEESRTMLWNKQATTTIVNFAEPKITIKLSDYVMQILEAHGVKRIYTLPGGGSMHLNDSLRKSNIEPVYMLHEQGAGCAATAEANITNGLAVVLVTSGPGSTNALTPCASAWGDSLPVLFISGQCKSADMADTVKGVRVKGSQEINIIDMVRPITKTALSLRLPRNVKWFLESSIETALAGRRGPVWIEIPLDVQAAEINPDDLTEIVDVPPIPPRDLHNDIYNLSVMLAKSKKPVVFAGWGVKAAGDLDRFRAVIQQIAAPVLLSWKAIDLLDENHPLYCGRPGGVGQRGANKTLQESDLVIILGVRLDGDAIGFNLPNFAPKAEKFIVDIDTFEMAKFPGNWTRCCTDISHFCKEFINFGLTLEPKTKWLKQSRQLHEDNPVVRNENREDTKLVDIYNLVDLLSDVARPLDIIYPSPSGMGTGAMFQAWKVKHGQRVGAAFYLGAMGFDIPQAIGYALATGKRVICVTGEGGFGLNLQELEAAQRLNLPIKFIVINNGGYASIRNAQRKNFGFTAGADKASGASFPSLCFTAPSFGIPYRVVKGNNCEDLLRHLLVDDELTIIEVFADPDQQFQDCITTKFIDGKPVSTGLEEI